MNKAEKKARKVFKKQAQQTVEQFYLAPFKDRLRMAARIVFKQPFVSR